MAVIGGSFHEVVALAQCLSETIRGVNLAGARPAVLERMASSFWRHSGVAPRICKSVANACLRSRLVLIAGPWEGADRAGELPISRGTIVVELRPGVSGACLGAQDAAIVEAPVLETPGLWDKRVALEPPDLASLVESALSSVSPETINFDRPQARDMRKIEQALRRHGVKAANVWNSRNAVSLSALTPLLA